MTLLRHTTGDVIEREALTINPAKTCQPVGAMYAALGIHNCLPHSHGSQGCCSYHRTVLTRHYKEPVMAATSSFTEGTSVFGGQANLLQAIQNIFEVYKPDVIAVHTTCLSETIGDDIPQIAKAALDGGKVPAGKYIIHCNTPSYVGSHVTGFSNMTRGMVHYFAEPTDVKTDQINLIPGWVEPSDMREIKRIANEMGVKFVMFPDTSGVLDCAMTGEFEMYPKGGTTIEQLKTTGSSKATLAMGDWGSYAAAELLDSKCKVPAQFLDLPIGLSATDRFIDALRLTCNVDVPESIIEERGQLVDMIADMHQYLYHKRVALWGDPDQLIALTEFLVDLDMLPTYVVTGTPGKRFEERIQALVKGFVPDVKVKQGAGADMYLMHQWIKQEPVHLLIGNTYGKYIARDEDIPLVRHGFPILDRVGHAQFPTVGYKGAMRLLEKILSALMDKQDRDSEEERFELVM
ncbi:TPA: nitrogenase molybdenum-iron protein subunit beta [Candidatus Sumerlaeota bacterium]|jgi:nitrogenase molybdenum-iron protein beta chain|nr:nitrogenase molybdenum-iron protein subunit beta [Candidatus Sumerlaeota bacterium]